MLERKVRGISTHALREEGDHYRGAGHYCVAISTHALREEGDRRRCRARRRRQPISTHALREEGDKQTAKYDPAYYISTHALREEGDWPVSDKAYQALLFLPTPSVRRATQQLKRGAHPR